MVYVTIEPKNQPMYQHHPHRYHGHEQQPNQFPPREPSPYNNSSSEKESTSSSINLGNTFRTNHGTLFVFNIFGFIFWFVCFSFASK